MRPFIGPWLVASVAACSGHPSSRPDGPADDAAAADAAPASTDSIGCTSGMGLAEGEHTFELEGLPRRYILRLPAGYSRDRAWPVVLALHPNGGSVTYWDSTSGDLDIRDVVRADAILVELEARGGNWRDYALDPSAWPPRLEAELRYIDAVVAQVRTDLCARGDGWFSMGFSGGGSFSGVLACRRPDIRAIAVGGAVEYVPEADCTRAVPAWITIGTDELEPGREQFRDLFRTLDGCGTASTATPPDPCVAYSGCASAAPVHYCQHAGGHFWPPFGAAAAWAFFLAQLPSR